MHILIGFYKLESRTALSGLFIINQNNMKPFFLPLLLIISLFSSCHKPSEFAQRVDFLINENPLGFPATLDHDTLLYVEEKEYEKVVQLDEFLPNQTAVCNVVILHMINDKPRILDAKASFEYLQTPNGEVQGPIPFWLTPKGKIKLHEFHILKPND